MALSPEKYLKKHGAKAFDRKMEKHFRGHREVPNGRNFMFWNKEKDTEADEKFRNNFDVIFPNSPGAGF